MHKESLVNRKHAIQIRFNVIHVTSAYIIGHSTTDTKGIVDFYFFPGFVKKMISNRLPIDVEIVLLYWRWHIAEVDARKHCPMAATRIKPAWFSVLTMPWMHIWGPRMQVASIWNSHRRGIIHIAVAGRPSANFKFEIDATGWWRLFQRDQSHCILTQEEAFTKGKCVLKQSDSWNLRCESSIDFWLHFQQPCQELNPGHWSQVEIGIYMWSLDLGDC